MLRKHGEVLVFWDCYRPHDVQVRMFQAVPDPNWVARPSDYARSHESGRSVDVTLADGHYGWLVDMGTDFDDFSPRALRLRQGRRHRRRSRRIGPGCGTP